MIATPRRTVRMPIWTTRPVSDTDLLARHLGAEIIAEEDTVRRLCGTLTDEETAADDPRRRYVRSDGPGRGDATATPQCSAGTGRDEVEGTAGGDLVTVTITGAGELVGLVIKPEAVDPEDTETLADLILAAVRDATARSPGPGVVQAGPAGRWARRRACPSERNRGACTRVRFRI